MDGDGSYEVIISMGSEIFDWIPGSESGRTSTGLAVAKTGEQGVLLILDSITGVVESTVSINNGALFTWFAQPAISVGDLNNDGVNEIILSSGDGYLYVISFLNGQFTAIRASVLDTYWPQNLNIDAPPIAASVLLVDINNDNFYEIISY